MSGGDVDVEPYLYSRNTIGHRNHYSNSQTPKCVKTCRSVKRVSDAGCGERWWYARAYAKVAVERGKTKLKIFIFVRNGWTTDDGRTTGSRRTSDVVRTSGAWAISGTG